MTLVKKKRRGTLEGPSWTSRSMSTALTKRFPTARHWQRCWTRAYVWTSVVVVSVSASSQRQSRKSRCGGCRRRCDGRQGTNEPARPNCSKVVLSARATATVLKAKSVHSRQKGKSIDRYEYRYSNRERRASDDPCLNPWPSKSADDDDAGVWPERRARTNCADDEGRGFAKTDCGGDVRASERKNCHEEERRGAGMGSAPVN